MIVKTDMILTEFCKLKFLENGRIVNNIDDTDMIKNILTILITEIQNH